MRPLVNPALLKAFVSSLGPTPGPPDPSGGDDDFVVEGAGGPHWTTGD